MPRRFRAPYSSNQKLKKFAKYKKNAKAQSKQIVALANKVSAIAEISSVPLQLRWQRSNQFIDRDPLTAGNSGTLTSYMCPLPVAPSQIAAAAVPDFGDTGPNQVIPTSDFRKSKIWITAVDANQKPRCIHRGGYITYKLNRINISLRYVKVFLVRTRPSIADQISLQRGLQYYDPATAVVAGQSAFLRLDYDYIHNPVATINDPVTGIQMNPQIWEVLGQHTYRFGTDKPFITSAAGNEVNTVGTPMRTDATGYFRLPAGGAVHKIWDADHTQQASNLNFQNQRSEKNVFLVVFSQRGSTITDPSTQPIADVAANEMKLSFQVRDTYSCMEGSLTPHSARHTARARRLMRGGRR